jgi:hypothetical protein
MDNIIAVIWDFDKTLVDGYMQDPIFEEYGVDGDKFWKEVDALPEKYMREQGVKVNRDTIYLNQFIRYAKAGTFAGLNNARLKEFGSRLKFYPGVPEILERTKEIVKGNKDYEACNISVEHYIVSTGFAQEIRGSVIMKYVDDVWGCELIEDVDSNGSPVISEIGCAVDNTGKTKALFEINKGSNKRCDINVNSKLAPCQRRIAFENMIYIADGQSDVPAFSVVKGRGGSTFAIYPKGHFSGFRQSEQLRVDDRVDMFAEADYREGTTASMWICNRILELANRIVRNENNRHEAAIKPLR